MIKKAVFDCNPFFIYIFSFLVPILLYQLDWSYLYPPLSIELYVFLFFTFWVSLLLGLYINKKGVLHFVGAFKKPRLLLILAFITIGNIMDFAYQRKIPLFSIVNIEDIENYGTFGIPTFAVFISTYGSFMTAYFFYSYIITKEKKYLFASLYLFIFPVLIFSRGTILLNLSDMLFLYLFSIRKNKGKVYFRMVILLLFVLLAFGYAGNIRSNNNADADSASLKGIMLKLGEAKPAFENSAIPSEFFWSYIYISSPLANLQHNINTYPVEYSGKSAFRYFNYELIFDSISKRIGDMAGTERLSNNLIAPYLTVGTLYSGPYTNLGWIGMGITFVVLMSICLVYVVVLKPDNPYYATGIAILNTLVLFNLFDNMISFTALSFQLLYPFLFTIKFKKSASVS
jgi:hypothetical protein